MNRIQTVIIVLTLSMLFVSCGSSSQQQTSKYVGTEGIQLEFLNRQPPDLVYDNLPFTIAVRVENKGAQGIESESDPIIIRSNLQSLFFLEPIDGQNLGKKETTLYGKQPGSPGEEVILEFGRFQALEDGPLQEGVEDIVVEACYPYRTTFSETICAKNPFATSSESICTPKDTYSYRGQGAPIAITEVSPVLIPQGEGTSGNRQYKPEYQIILRNVGDGSPHLSGPAQCDTISQRNTAVIQASLNGQPLDCGTNTVSFQNGQALKRCSLPSAQEAMRTNYQAILDVVVEYDYTSSVTKDVRVQPRPQ